MSKRLLALTEDQRNLAFTRLMAANHEACDRAIKTVFNASVGTIDDWEMLCNDGNSYSMSKCWIRERASRVRAVGAALNKKHS
jgi:hypothetical protein